MSRFLCLTAALLAFGFAASRTFFVAAAQTDVAEQMEHTVSLGDTWTALAWRSGITPEELIATSGTINPHRQPAIGAKISLPAAPTRNGRMLRPFAGGLLALSAANGRNSWTIAAQNDLSHPYRPLLYTALALPGGSRPPRELPPGFERLVLSPLPINPGQGTALQGHTEVEAQIEVSVEQLPLIVTQQEEAFIALGGTGAFYPPGQHTLTIQVQDHPLWEQPLTIADRDWTWDQVTFNKSETLDRKRFVLNANAFMPCGIRRPRSPYGRAHSRHRSMTTSRFLPITAPAVQSMGDLTAHTMKEQITAPTPAAKSVRQPPAK